MIVKRKDFIRNVKDIINSGKVEGISLSNVDILKSITEDKKLMSLFYEKFNNDYPVEYGSDMLFCKTQDFVYRLNIAINDWLIPEYNITDITDIKNTLSNLANEDIDLYSSVSYDDSDNFYEEEFGFLMDGKDIKL